jgi:glutamate synthase domain-containing protein 3
VAKTILDDWNNSINQFVKVMPRDYKRILLQRKENLKEAI